MPTFRNIGLLTALWSVALFGTAAAQVADISGEWGSSWGDTNFQPKDGGYETLYGADNGRLWLYYTVDGTYDGTWSEDGSSQRCDEPHPVTQSYHWGRINGPAPRSKTAFTLTWSYCDSENFDNRWTFTPKSEPVVADITRGRGQFEGNWRVVWEDSDEPAGFVTIFREYKWDCLHEDDNWCQKRIAPDAPILLSGGQLNAPYGEQPGGSPAITGSRMEVDWDYYHLGQWGGKSSLDQTSNNRLSGDWTYRDLTGRESWTRVQANVQTVESLHERADGTQYRERKPVGWPVTVTSEYMARNSYDMRGTRPSAQFEIFGDNLWGVHGYSIPRDTGIELVSTYHICADGNTARANPAAQSCMSNGGVAGIGFRLIFWSSATPGVKYLNFNGRHIPFNLNLRDYPTPAVFDPPQTQLSQVVLLDDQLGQRQTDEARTKNYSYPYDRDEARTAGLDSRMLAIIGKNLTYGDQTYLSSPDSKIHYEILTLPTNIQNAVKRAAISLSQKPVGRDEDIIAVRAVLEPQIRAGVKTLQINGQSGAWGLAFADQFGQLSFLRDGSSPGGLREHVFYTGETIRVGARAANDNYPIDDIEVELEARAFAESQQVAADPARRLRRITLERTDDIRRGENYAVGPPLLILREGDTSVTAGPEEQTLTLKANERLVARPTDRLSLFTIPPVVSAEVLDAPRNSDLWQSALDRVGQCPTIGGDPKSSDFPAEESETFENWILTDAIANLGSNRTGTRRITVTKGDHAALVLIRDALLPIVKRENDKLATYITDGDAGKTKAMRYYNDARRRPGSAREGFWASRTENFLIEAATVGGQPTRFDREIKLADLLDFEGFRASVRRPVAQTLPTIPDMRDDINRIVAKHLSLQYEDTKTAIKRGNDARDCNVKELLVIAGQKADPAVSLILPELMRRDNGRWVPDIGARGYVRGAHELGSAVRSQQDLAQIDDAYKSMAVALVAAPVAYGGAFAAARGGVIAAKVGTATAALAVGADLFDMAYFGKRGIDDYLNSEDDYFTQLGLAPVLGPEVVKDAESRRSNALAAAVGIIAPGVSGAAGLKALGDIRKINNGRALLRSRDGPIDLSTLDDSQRTDLAAYYSELRSANSSATAALTPQQQADLEAFNDVLRLNAPTSADEAVFSDSFLDLDFGNSPAPAAVTPNGGTAPPPGLANSENVPPSAALENNSTVNIPPPGSNPTDDLRKAETYIDPKEIWDLGPAERYEYPYRTKFGEGDANADGIIQTPVNPDFSLRDGTDIRLDTGETLRVGETLGEGGFRKVYTNPDEPEQVVKVLSFEGVEKTHGIKGDKLNTFLHDTDVGRELLTAIERSSPDAPFKVAKQHGPPLVIEDPNFPGRKFVVTKEDNISETLRVKQPDGTVKDVTVTDAEKRFAQRPDGQPTEAEIMTVQLTMRKLNQEGIVWTDHKWKNYDVIADDASPTGHKVVFFDLDGFRIAEGETSVLRSGNARQTQQIYDSAVKGDNAYYKMIFKGLPDFDHTIFGREMIPLSTAGVNVKRTRYLELDAMSSDEFDMALKAFADKRGTSIPYTPPKDNPVVKPDLETE